MAEQLIQLDIIDDNPEQDRSSYDEIPELGRSIALAGLQQKPKARQVGDRYQLKFGHRRKRAFEWLRDNWRPEGLAMRYSGYTVMPLEVEEATDDEMFDSVLIENFHRDDLKVTEKARLLRRYKEVHPDATSEQIGLVFNMNAATVRGMDIFLDLPEEVQAKLDDGTLSQGAARLLHSMMKITTKEQVLKTLKLIEEEKGRTLPEEVIDHEIDHLPNTVDMWSSHQSGKPRAGYRGWLLDMKNFPNRLLPAMTVEQVGAYEAQIDHLTNPPACTACRFYTKVRGSHYCGMKLCHQRRMVAWELYAVEQASKSTKIPVYTEEDGTYRALGYDTSHLFEKRHKDLRLIPRSAVNGYSYQNFKGFDDDLVMVVATGEELLAKMARSTGTSGGARGGKKTEKEKAEMRAMKVYRIKRLELMWAYTAAVAQTIFEGTPAVVLTKLNEWNHIGIDDRIPEQYNHPQTGDAAQKLSFQRRALVWRLIMNKTSHYTRSGMVEALNKFAAVTGVKAPKTLVKLAEEWDAEIKAVASVSAATGRKK
jgi:ParB-like chromosome segregation protein Spo0J